jgi:hypothetical protein
MARRPARRADRPSELLTLSGVTAVCVDCGDERLFLPTDDALDSREGAPGEYCCTSCDAAVFLLAVVAPAARGDRTSHVA